MSLTGEQEAKVLSLEREDCSDMENESLYCWRLWQFLWANSQMINHAWLQCCCRCVNSHPQKQEGWYNMRRQWRRDLIASLKLPYSLLQYFICGRIFWVYCNCRDWCNAQAKTVIYYCFEIAFQSTLVANKCLKYQLENDVVEKGFKQLKINTNMIWKNFVFKHVLLFVSNVSQWWNHCVYD